MYMNTGVHIHIYIYIYAYVSCMHKIAAIPRAQAGVRRPLLHLRLPAGGRHDNNNNHNHNTNTKL